jgi:hypothetical protein
MKRYFIIVAVAMAVLMQGSPAEARDRYEKVKSVGILCGIKDKILLGSQGVFNQSFNSIVLPSLRTCDHIVAWTTHALSQRFEIKPVAYSAEEVERCRDDCAHVLPRNGDVDAYVVIHPVFQPEGNWLIAGLGFTHFPSAIIGPDTFLQAYFRVVVYDAKTHKQIDFGTAHAPLPDLIGALPASVEFDKAHWIGMRQDLTPARVDAIRSGMLRLVRIALAMALSGANLMPRPAYSKRAHVVAMVAGREPIPYFAGAPDPVPPQSPPPTDPAAARTANPIAESASPAHQAHGQAPVSGTESTAPSQVKQNAAEPQ